MTDIKQRIAELRSIERRVTPDAAWMRRTRDTLLMQVKNTLPTRAATRRESLREAIRHFAATNAGAILRKPVMAVMSMVALAMGGSLMSVSAAERSYPGDFFYGLKLATEQARLAWVSSKNDKLKLKTEFTDRRVQELREVASVRKDNEGVKQVAEILKRDMNTIKEQLTDVKDTSPEDAVEAAKLVDQKSVEVMNALQETKPGLGLDTKQKMTDAQSVAADTSVKAIEVLVEKSQEASSTVPAADLAKAIESHANAVLSATQADNLSGATSTTSTVTLLVQNIASSTASGATSTLELSKVVDQMKDLTTQAFAEQKANSSASSTESVITPPAPPEASSTSSTNATTSTTSVAPSSSTSSQTVPPPS